MTGSRRIPVTIVSGFLGSGKTTLLRESLSGDPSCAVIVNEFGAASFDHRLLRSSVERIEVVSGGCACCARRADLVEVLRDLLDEHERGTTELRRVVIETSGLADPAPIVATVTSDAMLRHHFDVERLTVCVDAVHGLGALAANREAQKQVAIADELVITKLDLAEPDGCRALDAALRELNPHALRACARHGRREALPPAFTAPPADGGPRATRTMSRAR
jgi:G3E family GTPase